MPAVNSKASMNRVCVGMHIEIKRSDGRVHGAVVTEVKDSSVNVEWFEKGETKGKEIDYASMIRANPSLDPNISRVKSDSTLDVTVSFPVADKPSFAVPALPPTRNGHATSAVSIAPSVSTASTAQTAAAAASVVPSLPTPTLTHAPSAPTVSNKSACVNEIERLAQKRDERRSYQAEAKRQKNERQQIDPGNPNWQFLTMIRDYRAQIGFRPLQLTDIVTDNKISVCVRKRPLSKAEILRKEIEVLTIPNKDHVIVHQPQVKVDLTKYLENQRFRFDYSFDENSSNEMVYKFTAQPLVKTVFQGGFATCFAYGQTGSGKTHTMGGNFQGKSQDCAKGIYALTAIDVFKMIRQPEYRTMRLEVKCSFFEIYGGKVFDLLGRRAVLRILEDGNRSVQVVGLNETTVNSPDDVLKLIKHGSDQRTAGSTSANANSSRSHAVFQIMLKRSNNELYGKFSLIDLAGNERGADTTSSDRQTRLEGAEINKSLLALKECIRAMSMNKSHIPFRMSKLTLVLRDSFVNQNAKTCMIAMVSPGLNSVENTLNTLRYADRVKELGSDEDGALQPMDEEEFMTDTSPENDSPSEDCWASADVVVMDSLWLCGVTRECLPMLHSGLQAVVVTCGRASRPSNIDVSLAEFLAPLTGVKHLTFNLAYFTDVDSWLQVFLKWFRSRGGNKLNELEVRIRMSDAFRRLEEALPTLMNTNVAEELTFRVDSGEPKEMQEEKLAAIRRKNADFCRVIVNSSFL